MSNKEDLTPGEFEVLARNVATKLPALLCVDVLRVISEVQRRRTNERTCSACGGPLLGDN